MCVQSHVISSDSDLRSVSNASKRISRFHRNWTSLSKLSDLFVETSYYLFGLFIYIFSRWIQNLSWSDWAVNHRRERPNMGEAGCVWAGRMEIVYSCFFCLLMVVRNVFLKLETTSSLPVWQTKLNFHKVKMRRDKPLLIFSGEILQQHKLINKSR